MIDYLAPKWGGLVFFPEQRYYGSSIPSDSMKFLTTQNVLEDYVELLNHIKEVYNAESCPVLAFGGSYGGTLTTLMRAAYPSAIIGGLASSAPAGYYDPKKWASHGVTEFTFADIISDSYNNADPQCLAAISAVTDAIEKTSTEKLVVAFNLCDASGLGPHKSDLYLYGLVSATSSKSTSDQARAYVNCLCNATCTMCFFILRKVFVLTSQMMCCIAGGVVPSQLSLSN